MVLERHGRCAPWNLADKYVWIRTKLVSGFLAKGLQALFGFALTSNAAPFQGDLARLGCARSAPDVVDFNAVISATWTTRTL